MKRIAICSDSFGTDDFKYDNLSWSDKLKSTLGENNVKILNFSESGVSNSLIELQVHQSINFNPDAVIVSFTHPGRTEFFTGISKHFSKNAHDMGDNTDVDKIKKHTRSELTPLNLLQSAIECNAIDHSDGALEFFKFYDYGNYCHDFNIIKSYFSVISILSMLRYKKIPFCYSLGGLDSAMYDDYFKLHTTWYDQFKNRIISNYDINDELPQFYDNKISVNPWNHAVHGEGTPTFHITDHQIQQQFADECVKILGL